LICNMCNMLQCCNVSSPTPLYFLSAHRRRHLLLATRRSCLHRLSTSRHTAAASPLLKLELALQKSPVHVFKFSSRPSSYPLCPVCHRHHRKELIRAIHLSCFTVPKLTLSSPCAPPEPLRTTLRHPNRSEVVFFFDFGRRRRREHLTVARPPWLLLASSSSCFVLLLPPACSCPHSFLQRISRRAETPSSSSVHTAGVTFTHGSLTRPISAFGF
jgi:hypothetical protein